MIHVRAADCPVQLWRNGGGETREMAIEPVGAGFDDCLWRISLATIAASGPFSRFAGMNRTLVALSGGPMTLRIGQVPVAVMPHVPIRFDGETAVEAGILGSPAMVLNIMARRGAATASMHAFDGHRHQGGSGRQYLVATGSCTIAGIVMACGDLLYWPGSVAQIVCAGASPLLLRLDGSGK
jgi:environmental stress-induced protein Ves